MLPLTFSAEWALLRGPACTPSDDFSTRGATSLWRRGQLSATRVFGLLRGDDLPPFETAAGECKHSTFFLWATLWLSVVRMVYHTLWWRRAVLSSICSRAVPYKLEVIGGVRLRPRVVLQITTKARRDV